MRGPLTLGQYIERDQSVKLPAEGRGGGLYVIGDSGLGKTTFLESLVLVGGRAKSVDDVDARMPRTAA